MGLIDSLKKGFSGTVQKAESAASSAAHQVEDVASSTVDKAKSVGWSAVKKAETAVDKVEGAATSAAQKTTRTVGDTFQTVKKKVGPILNAVNPWGTSPDKKYDGMLLGKNGQTYPAGTPVSQVPGVTPKGGVRNNDTIIYTNGIQTTKEVQSASLQAIADKTGSKVVGVHNATESFAADAKQVFTDKMKGANPAVDSLAGTVYDELKAGRSVHLMSHSQGGLVTARALSEVKNRLMIEDGMSKGDAEKLLGKVNCETFGAAAAHYTDGPKYTHNINRLDPVPNTLGLGEATKWDPLTDAGKGAKVNYFTESHGLNLIANHSFDSVYLNHRQTPEAP